LDKLFIYYFFKVEKMSRIDIGTKINIFLVGSVASVLLFFLFEVIFARTLMDTVIGQYDDYTILFLIILGLQLISLIVPTFVSLWITENVSKSSIYIATFLAFLTNIVFLIGVSYVSLFILYPQVFDVVEGFEIILVLPSVLVYFGIYVLGNVFVLFIVSVVSYYIFYLIFLEKFYKYKAPGLRK